jgi:hypothetical protein
MTTQMNWARLAIGLVTLSLVAGACQSDVTAPTRQPAMDAVTARTTNGAAGQQPAFYDGKLFTVNMKPQPVSAAAALIAHNGSINQIYASNDLEDPQEFIPVLDAIQGDGFNPLWRRNLIVFNAGFTPHQFHSDTEVLAAAAGPNPEITIIQTNEMYRCSVVGSK